MTLAGKNVLVVGGGSGIGLSTARLFRSSNCNVAIAGRNEEKLRKAAADSENAIRYRSVDVSDRRNVASLIQWFESSVGETDIFVNAAGVNIKTRTMAEMTPQQWDQVMNINATGAYNCLYHVLPSMRKRQDGLVINISSISGKRAYDLGGIAYCASKFAMTALGTSIGQEEAKNGIRITNVYPGEVDTPILLQRPTPVSDEHRARILRPEDVAQMVVAIASLPARAHVPEIVIKPRLQEYV